MDATTLPRDRLDLVAVVRLLVLLQGAVLVAQAIEAAVAISFTGASGTGALALTSVGAALTLLTAAGIGRRSRLARRWTLIAEGWLLLTGAVDLAIAVVLAQGDIPLMTLVVRMVLPLAVIRLLRRAEVRAAFAGPERPDALPTGRAA